MTRRRIPGLALLLCLATLPLSAATFVVTNTNDSGPGSLRAAIGAVNALTTEDSTINFSIGTGPQTIQPLTTLYLTTGNNHVTIDGNSQPGFAGKPLIELDGSQLAGNANLLSVSNAVIRSLILNGAPEAGLEISSPFFGVGESWVDNCYLGTDRTGTHAARNQFGIVVWGSIVHIGETSGNVISGNSFVGVRIFGGNTSVKNNLIGLTADGSAMLSNTGYGVEVLGGTSTVGAQGQGNYFASANFYYGMLTVSSATATVIGNTFGLTTGGAALPGGAQSIGVALFSAGDSYVKYNTITNHGTGIAVSDNSKRNLLSQNSIYDNGLGIDLWSPEGIGVSVNDAGDTDGGGNQRQNFPVLTSATVLNGVATIDGVLDSAPNAEYSIELYGSPACNSGGYGEGKHFLGNFSATTDGAGHASFSRQVPVPAEDHVVTATAMDAVWDSSEFSACTVLQGAGILSIGSAQTTEGATGQLAVTRAGGAAGSITVAYSTFDNSAIAGRDYVAAAGTLTFNPGETSKTIPIATIQDAIYGGLRQLYVQLSNPTGGATVAAGGSFGTLTIVNDESAPQANFVFPSFEVTEGNSGTARITPSVTLTQAARVPVTVSISTRSDTATAGADFLSVNTAQLTFAPGETSKTTPIDVVGDTVAEDDERFFVDLSPVSNVAVGPRNTVNVTIIDDEPKSAFSVSDATVVEGNGGSTNAVFTVSTPVPVLHTTVIGFFVTDGTAIAGRDYQQLSFDVYFHPGELSHLIAIPIIGDTTPETDETFNVRIETLCCTPAAIARANGVGTIRNDDYGFGPDGLEVPQGGSAQLTLAFGSPLTAPATVQLLSSDPAVASVPATVTIPAGAAGVSLDVTGVAPGRATITATLPASLGGTVLNAAVSVYTSVALTFSPSPLQMPAGTSRVITVKLDPAQATDTLVTLEIANLGVIDSPARVTVPPSGTATFTITALKVGGSAITASLPSQFGPTRKTLIVDVVDATGPMQVTAISPSRGPMSGGTAITIDGVNFSADCLVSFGGPFAHTVFVSPVKLTATTPPHAAATIDVNVICGTSVASTQDGFTFTAPRQRASRK
jgi:parallel beta-helix repeat protein